MKSSEEFDRQLQSLHSCKDFLLKAVPNWEIDAVDPIVGLETGVVNCAGRKAIAVAYLRIFGVSADFAFRTVHGQPDRYGEPKMGHTLVLAPEIIPRTRLGIDSDDDGNVDVTLIGEERQRAYRITTLEEGYPEY